MSYLLAVDWGTTWTAAAVGRARSVEIAPLASHETLAPSVAHLDTSGTWTYGETARRRGAADPVGLARHFKRRFADPTPLVIQGAPVRADVLAAGLIGWVLEELRAREGGPPETLCLTHPAPWSDVERDLLREIASSLHPDVRLLSEPEAVAVHYGTQERVPDDALVAIYDFGGGTFDATVLARRRGSFEVLGVPAGVADVGGVDLDAIVMQLVVEHLGERWRHVDASDPATRRALERLRRDSTLAKESLSTELDVVVAVDLPNLTAEVRLTRAEVEERFRPLIERTMTALQRALLSADIAASDLHAVLLAGGSSRIPLVGEVIAQRIGRPVAIDVHPKLAVALGAARSIGSLAAPLPSEPDRTRRPAPPPPRPEDVPIADDVDSASEREALPIWLVGAVMVVLIGLVIAAIALLRPSGGGNDAATDSSESTTSTQTSSSTTTAEIPSGTLPSRAVEEADDVIEYFADPLTALFMTFVSFEADFSKADCEARLDQLEQQHFVLDEESRVVNVTPIFGRLLQEAPNSISDAYADLVQKALDFFPRCRFGLLEPEDYQPIYTAYENVCSRLLDVTELADRDPICAPPTPPVDTSS